MEQELLWIVKMLKKKFGLEAIERNWYVGGRLAINFKIPSILTIPKSVKKVGDFAFCNCEKLKEVEIPEGVEEIGYCAFENCPELWEVEIPKSIKIIGSLAFWNCRELREVVIPENIEEIGNSAFENCKNAIIILKKHNKVWKGFGFDAFLGVRDVKEEIRY